MSRCGESLRDCGIADGITIYCGVGRHPGLSFVDIDADAAPKAISWAESGPGWCAAKPGLCIEGVCKKRGCRAFRKSVVMNFGFTCLNLVSRSHEGLCPECHGHGNQTRALSTIATGKYSAKNVSLERRVQQQS